VTKRGLENGSVHSIRLATMASRIPRQVSDSATRELLGVVGSVYEAALEPTHWDAVVKALLECTESHAGSIALRWLHDLTTRGEALGAVQCESYLRDYDERLHELDPLGPRILERGPRSVFVDDEIIGDWDSFWRTVYGKAVLSHGLGRFIGWWSPALPEAFLSVSLHRPPGARGYETRDQAILSQVVPHLDRAVQIRNQLELSHGGAVAALDELVSGVVITDSAGHVVLANRAALRQADEKDGLCFVRGEIRLATPAATSALRAMLSEASRTTRGMGISDGGVLAIERPSGRRPLHSIVTPLAVEAAADRWGHRACAALLLSDPDAEVGTSTRLLRVAYGLTPTEARVAVCVAAGDRLEDIAKQLEVRVQTIRSHLKNIFQKTDTHRQAELVRLVLAGPSRP
jgi:DNA-binding CsgD family transcriptional regulator/PAS domain-containing protein